MAKEVVWSLRAQKERKEILEYWRLRSSSSQSHTIQSISPFVPATYPSTD
ncbi:MAG: hypothetical protein OEV24_15550 [Cyclobacteriaceae bacterium]|nr:hypothetical protein [Cyclobacteriaceae bacterium]